MAHVLLIDDEIPFREILVRALKRRGHRISTSSTGRGALDLGSRTRPDVLLTDWLLRDHVNGLQVLESLRLVDSKLPGILMTGYLSSDLQQEAERIDVAQILEEPFDLDVLGTSVSDALEGESPSGDEGEVAIFDLRPHHSIAWKNPRAQELVAQAGASANARHLDQLFGKDDLQILE